MTMTTVLSNLVQPLNKSTLIISAELTSVFSVDTYLKTQLLF